MKWHAKPGETPLDDLSGLKLRIVNPTRTQIERFEAANIVRAQEKYFVHRLTRRSALFDLPWLKKLHREMFGDVWIWAGKFRTTALNIGVSPQQIQMQLLQLLNDLHAWPDMGMDWIEQSVRLHHRSVLTHPFINGNGRWARMLANIWLRRHKQPIVMWPAPTAAESPIRQDYLAALRQADDMDYGPLIRLHRDYQE